MAIVNFGSLNIDYVYSVPHFCEGGETLTAEARKVSIGGKGLNQSIAIAHSGVEVFHVGLIGPGGEILRDCLDRNGVNTSLLQSCGTQQGHTVIQVTPSGQNCIIVFGGSNRAVSKEFIDACLTKFQVGDYMILQNEVSNLSHLIEAGRRKGLKIVLNASPIDGPLLAVDFSKVDWLVVNEIECARIAGVGVSDVTGAYETLCKRYPDVGILLTLGENGSVCHRGSQEYRQDAFRTKAVDTTGAGDTFMGFFVGCLTQGYAIPDAMRCASMASSIAVSRPGAAESIPYLSEVRNAL